MSEDRSDITQLLCVKTLRSNARQRRLLLRVVAGGIPFTFRVIDPAARVTVGRGDVDLVLADQNVSRAHALVQHHGDSLSVVDLGSTNGTLLNGTALTRNIPATFAPGDELTLGALTLRLDEVDIDEIRYAEELASRSDSYQRDGLTGLFNRAGLDQHLDMLDAGRLSSVLFLDIDHFKRVNDTQGHSAGDRALQSLAAILTRAARSGDFVARYGGEEFVIVCHLCSEAGAMRLGDRVRLACRRFDWERAGIKGPISVSIGVAERDEQEPWTSWLRRADEALFAAKRSGRDRCVAAPMSLKRAGGVG